ncbi:MAG: hypothetical protein DDT30_02008 [Dehalococcoidia bacterium]|nr:hypothetical protein [Bacillota bacterium]MBT9143944.1 hypothetical protein [Bacillota bacterium]
MAQSIVIGEQTRFLSPFYLELASQSLQRYKRSRKKPVTGYLEVFILVAASLEAFINEVCLEKIERHKETGKSTRYLESVMSRNNRDRSIRDKWKLLSKCLWRGKKFDRRSRLWRDFNALIELRNLLVHYKSEYKQPGYVPKVLKPVLARVLREKKQKPTGIGFLESLLGKHKHWTELICSAEMGYWALNTGLNMISHFLEFAPASDDIKDDYISMLSRFDWFRQHIDYRPYRAPIHTTTSTQSTFIEGTK